MFADKRSMLLWGVGTAAVIAVFSLDPIAQDTAYHLFSDRRGGAGIPNVYNVLSNLPFAVIGFMGMRLVVRAPTPDAGFAQLRIVYICFFAGVFLTAFGSAYYHWNPGNATLLWDRLPMTIAFTALFCAVIGEYIALHTAQKFFPPLLLVGVASAFYWHVSESYGRGDLRPYVLVQFLPMLLIPLILWLYRPQFDDRKFIWGMIGAYAASKLAEYLDATIYRSFDLFSGHTLKHVLAALAVYIYYLGLRARIKRKDMA
jgi:hypothetical protein